MNPFKDAFKDCDLKFTQPQSRAHIFITQNLFNERLSVAGYKLPFGDKIWGSKFWQIFPGFILAYDDNCNYFESTQNSYKRTLYKITKTPINHVHNNKLKSRSF